MAHVETSAREVAIREIQSDRFGTADAGVQQREEDGAIAAAHDRGAVAAGDQAGDLRGRQGRHDLAGQADIAEAAEGVVVGVAGGAQPGAEAAHLAEIAVAGIGAVGGEADEIGDDVIGTEAVRIQRRPILDEAAGEAGQRLPIGLDGAGRLAFDHAAGQVGGDEGGQQGVGKGLVHGPSMDALRAREVKAAPPRTAGLLGAAGGWRQRRLDEGQRDGLTTDEQGRWSSG